MPDIGLIELALIGLIGFLVLGPERLPDFFAQIGKVVRQGRAWMAGVRTQLEHERQMLVKPVAEVQESLRSSADDVNEQLKNGKERD